MTSQSARSCAQCTSFLSRALVCSHLPSSEGPFQSSLATCFPSWLDLGVPSNWEELPERPNYLMGEGCLGRCMRSTVMVSAAGVICHQPFAWAPPHPRTSKYSWQLPQTGRQGFSVQGTTPTNLGASSTHTHTRLTVPRTHLISHGSRKLAPC